MYLINIYKELTVARHHLNHFTQIHSWNFHYCSVRVILFWSSLYRGRNKVTGRLRSLTPKSPQSQEVVEPDSGCLSPLPLSLPVLLPRKALRGQRAMEAVMEESDGSRWHSGSRPREGIKEVCGTIEPGLRLSDQPTCGWGRKLWTRNATCGTRIQSLSLASNLSYS